jgi:3-hydroxybutyrate dehydrogenase
MRLEGKVALVTGAASGIGKAIAERLADEGAAIVIADIQEQAGEEVAAANRAKGRKAQFVRFDVTDPASIESGFAQVAKTLGPVTILVNNAGIARAAPFGKTDQAFWDLMMKVDLTGPFLCIKAAMPGMLQAGFGRIVNIASTAGQTGYAYCAAYCAAKHGLVGMSRALAREYASKPVTINCVCPGYADTPIVESAIANIVSKTGRSREDALAELVAHNPQGRLIQPQEVADAVTWLCLPGSASVTGQNIGVAGGEMM